jgi:hypothetical protein
LTPLVAGQRRKGTRCPLEIVFVDNASVPEIPVNALPEPMPYA